MEQFKGTPAPWKIHSMARFQIVGSLIKPDDKAYDSYYPGICSTRGADTYVSMPFEQSEANAYLISAAPELLEALVEMQNAITMLNCPVPNNIQNKAVMAINKALSININP